jgi:alpha-glucosidase
LLLAMQLSLRGTPCIYEGEELGLSEAVLSYDEIQDPYGKTFWPDFKGRDGCRTPIPWDASPGAGFTTGKPWLPIPEAQRQRSVATQEDQPHSTLNRARTLLHWRRTIPALIRGDMHFHDAPEPILALSRKLEGKEVFCVFNLGRTPQAYDTTRIGTVTPLGGHGFASRLDGATVVLPPFTAFFGDVG